MGAQKIIEGLKQAISADFARVTIEGVTWVREDLAQKPHGCICPAGAEAGCHGIACPRHVPYGCVLPQMFP